MKIKKDKINVETNSTEICKKCGEPLRSINRNKYCDNCRRERATKKKEILSLVGGLCILGLSIVPGAKHFKNKK